MMTRSIKRSNYFFGSQELMERSKRKLNILLATPTMIPGLTGFHKYHNDDDDDDDNGSPFKFTKLFNQSDNDVYSEKNHIYFKTDVTEESINKLAHEIRNVNNKIKSLVNKESYGIFTPNPIILHITTRGGDLLSGFFGYDVVKNSKIPIHTIIEGSVASAGSLLSIAGSRRYITENSHILIHQLRTGMFCTYEELKEEKQNCNKFMNKLINLYHQNCNDKMNKTEIRDFLKHDLFWDSKKSIEQGIVDEIWYD
jgi:ATP-dependent protease ClpP protease subunit